ncbi:hypothetical protein A2U01_0088087, partial [Trifolium medium]|nr:hypothetical protein [Trifolium medium]
FCQLRAAQGVLARCGPMLQSVDSFSASCASRRSGRRVVPVS